MNGINENQKTRKYAQGATHLTGTVSVKTKKCSRCIVEKEWSEFNKAKKGKFGLKSECRDCSSKENKKYYCENKDKVLKNNRLLYEKNKGKERIRSRKYREDNKEKELSRSKKYYLLNRDKTLTSQHERIKNNPKARLSRALRSRLAYELQNIRKTDNEFCLELLGCSLKYFSKYVEFQFTDGMSWNNHCRKGWHLDHIKPCVSFDLTDPEQQKECFHYSNFQPLWAIDNIKKRDLYRKQSNQLKA